MKCDQSANSLIQIEDLLTKDMFLRLEPAMKRKINRLARKTLEYGNGKRKVAFAVLRSFLNSVFTRGDNVKALIELSNIPLCDVQSNVIAVRRGSSGYNKPVEIKLPVRPNPALALLVAKSMGDGGISNDWRFSYDNKQLELINEVAESVKKAIGNTKYETYLRKRDGYECYEIKFSSTIGFLLNMVGSPKGVKVDSDFGVPLWIKSGTTEIKSAFLRGIFDDECCIHMRKRKRVITLAMGKSENYSRFLELFFQEIKLMLDELGVRSKDIYLQGRYGNKLMLRFSIYGEDNFKTFNERIGFTHKKKDDIMRSILGSFVDIHKTRNSVLNAVESSNKPIGTYEISESIGINQKLVRLHLRNLVEEKMIFRSHGTVPAVWYVHEPDTLPKSKKEMVFGVVSSNRLTTLEIAEKSGVSYKYAIVLLHRLNDEGFVDMKRISNHIVWSMLGKGITASS